MDPWKVDRPAPGVLRFTNTGPRPAIQIRTEAVGDLTVTDTTPTLTQREPGEHFDRTIHRITGTGRAAIRVNWTVPGVGPRTWTHCLT